MKTLSSRSNHKVVPRIITCDDKRRKYQALSLLSRRPLTPWESRKSLKMLNSVTHLWVWALARTPSLPMRAAKVSLVSNNRLKGQAQFRRDLTLIWFISVAKIKNLPTCSTKGSRISAYANLPKTGPILLFLWVIRVCSTVNMSFTKFPATTLRGSLKAIAAIMSSLCFGRS